MNRRAQKQILHVLAISWGLATSVDAHAGLELPHLLPPLSRALPHLCDGEHPLPTRHHLVPLVMQQIDETGRLVAADELGQVGGEW